MERRVPTLGVRYLLACLLLAGLGACGEAGVPSGLQTTSSPLPLEIPTALGIDVEAIRGEGASTKGAQAVAPSGAYAPIISSSGESVHDLSAQIDRSLDVLRNLEVPSASTVTNFEITYEVPSGDRSAFDLPATYELKIDFAPFDLDGDGVDEACSGHTLDAPVCVRLWLNDVRTMAAIFTTKPTSATKGAGRMIINDRQLGGGAFFDEFGIVYDRVDPEQITSEFFNHPRTLDNLDPGTPLEQHIRVVQTGSDPATALKTVFFTSKFLQHPDGFDAVQYISRWRDAGTLLVGSSNHDLTLRTIDPFCALLSNGDDAGLAACEADGLSIAGESYIGLAVPTDYTLPPASEFPLTPTF